ncbi:MAG: hypothetical protein JO314_06005, partial [Acidobacteria bacterium]|nr:hypothetical protein [Acidobacteriota bacterium]
MKTVILTLAAVALLAVGAVAQPQDQTARRLANKMAVAFFAGMGSLDHRHLLRGPLQVSLQLDEPDTA